MDNSYKEQLIATGLFTKTSGSGQYRCNCPFCIFDKGKHLYVKIDVRDDSPILYNCFKCNARGVMNSKLLELLGVRDIRLPRMKLQRKVEQSKLSESNSMITVGETDDVGGICQYINDRVGHYPTLDELKCFQYIGNPSKYVDEYLKGDKRCLKDRYWFKLSNGNITGRYRDDSQMRWMKYRPGVMINPMGIYTIKTPFDIYQPINVVIAEGIFDVIGLYYNYSLDNPIYVAVLGKDYYKGIKYVLDRGIFGTNVSIKIFKDQDVQNVCYSDNVRKLFKQIDVYENMSAKDYGVLPDELDIFKILNKKT